MGLLSLPFPAALEEASHVLIAGAGGGFDVFSGLPLYFALRDQGRRVTLANLSFATLRSIEDRVTDDLVRVTAESSGSNTYFPERFLSDWFKSQGEDVPVYAIEATGSIPIREGYQSLIDELKIDAFVLVDGGTDSLMRGDEDGLGTPHEDMASLAAAANLKVARKHLVCLGFGIDAFHGVCHAHFLEAVAELSASNAFHGAFSLLPQMSEVKRFRAASEFVFSRMPHKVSIVTSSILSAIEGRYGDYHATERTRGSRLWINPLMSLYWCFDLMAAANRVLYIEAMKQTRTMSDVIAVIEAFKMRRRNVRRYEALPL